MGTLLSKGGAIIRMVLAVSMASVNIDAESGVIRLWEYGVTNAGKSHRLAEECQRNGNLRPMLIYSTRAHDSVGALSKSVRSWAICYSSLNFGSMYRCLCVEFLRSSQMRIQARMLNGMCPRGTFLAC